MTSMPASRSARATTLAPRSCPSSPGLATMIRSGPGAATGASDITDANLRLGGCPCDLQVRTTAVTRVRHLSMPDNGQDAYRISSAPPELDPFETRRTGMQLNLG